MTSAVDVENQVGDVWASPRTACRVDEALDVENQVGDVRASP